MPKTLVGTALVSSAANTAGSTVRARVSVDAVDGGMITMRITNGGTGPTLPCTGRVFIAHKQASMPATAGEGTGDGAWKQVAEFGGGSVASVSTRFAYRFGPEVAYAQVEFTGNTGQSVTVEAHVTTFVF